MSRKGRFLGREGVCVRDAARDSVGKAATLRVRQAQDDAVGRMTRGSGVRIDMLSAVEEQMMIGGLLAMVKGLVADFNRAAGAAVLYFCEYVSVWALFALRGKNKCDTCVATGCSTVGDLAALVDRLQRKEGLAKRISPEVSVGNAV